MDKKKRPFFRRQLVAALEELMPTARKRDLVLAQIETDDPGKDDGDLSLFVHERYLWTRVATQASDRIRAIVAAIRRCDKGTYGDCLECDSTISEKRLKAHPEAALCIQCQQKAETP